MCIRDRRKLGVTVGLSGVEPKVDEEQETDNAYDLMPEDVYKRQGLVKSFFELHNTCFQGNIVVLAELL